MPLDAADLATLSRLLDEAFDLAPDALPAWLAALPPAQQHLRPQLQEMLERRRATAHAGFLSDGPRLDAVDPSAPRAGERVGPYVLIRELGQGGMGTVWLAARADGALRRQVALKLPRLAWGAGLAKRMARERDILARLEHPNIARLYDAGVDEQGRPYLALEFIDGQPIDAWCEARALPLRERLALIVQVAHAVGVAHGSLVVHRDLKPSNILVTSDGTAHLLDFGIAKLLEATDATDGDVTQTQARLLTPRYASPEQAEGRPVTVASDVYSLGVVLHQLLTGRLPALPSPHEDTAPASRCVTDRSVARTLRGDLDAIVGKALRHDPARRYETMQAFAGDLENHLAGRPVQARPDGALYIAGRFARRHWLGLSAVAAVCAAIVVGGATAIVQARHAAREAERARAATEFVAELFRLNAAGPGVDERASTPTEFIDRGATLIQARFAGQPEMQAELLGAVGSAYDDMGANALAVEYANRRLQVLQHLPDTRRQQVQSLLLASSAHMHDEDAEEAEAEAARALDIAAPEPDLRIDALAALARAQLDDGHVDQARKSIQTGEQLLMSNPRLDGSINAARLLGAKEMLLTHEGRLDEAKPLLAMVVQQALQREGPGSRLAEDLLYWRAIALERVERFKEAQAAYEQAMKILRQRGGNLSQAREAVNTANFFTVAYVASGNTFDLHDILARVRASRDVLQRLGATVPPVLHAKVDFAIGRLYLHWTDVASAEKWLTPSIQALLASRPSLRTQMVVMGEKYELEKYTGQDNAAMASALQAFNLVQRWTGHDGPRTLAAYGVLANELVAQGKLDRAAQVLDQVPHLDTVEPNRWETTSLLSARIKLAMARGDVQRAFSLLPPLERMKPEELELVQPIYGRLLCATGQREHGIAVLRQMVREELATGTFVDDPDLALYRGRIGLCALAAHQRSLAIACAIEARRVFNAQPIIGQRFREPLIELEKALGPKALQSNTQRSPTGNVASGDSRC